MEQSAARWAHNPKVGGSSPSPATKKGYPKIFFFYLKIEKEELRKKI